jgi:G3E family GTPase
VNAATLRDFPEAIKQVSMADRLVVTKLDLTDPTSLAGLRSQLRSLNLSAQIVESTGIGADPCRLLTDDIYDTAGKFREASLWSAEETEQHSSHEHATGIQSFVVLFDRPLDWTAFGVWASMLLHSHGANVLRLKGLLHVAGVPTPVLINGVQHIVHPPSHLPEWPDADRRSRLIFIVRGLQRSRIERSLAVFNQLVDPPLSSVRPREGEGSADSLRSQSGHSAIPISRE